MDSLTPSEYRAILRNDLFAFAERVFYTLSPETKFVPAFFLEQIAAKLTAVLEGEIKRLVICLPPRSLKSIVTSVAFPAWVLGHDPSKQIICVSYTQDLSDKFARDTRIVMTAPCLMPCDRAPLIR